MSSVAIFPPSTQAEVASSLMMLHEFANAANNSFSHFMTQMSSMSVSNDESSSQEKRERSMKLLTQPAKYQICNYNIHPAPIVSLEGMDALQHGEQICVELVQGSSRRSVASGFVKGDVQEVYSRTIIFSGLKLNKKGSIKSNLKSLGLSAQDDMFQLRFVLQDVVCYSDPFKLISNYNQLPDDFRMYLRPRSKNGSNRGSIDDELLDEVLPQKSDKLAVTYLLNPSN